MKVMKKKFVFLLLAIFGLATMINVSATSTAYWVNVTLPRLSGVETGNGQNKTIAGSQHFQTTKAKDNLSGDTRAISVRTLGDAGASEWISAPVNSIVTWSKSQANGNTATGHYYSQVKATKSTLSTVNFSGTWYLDDSYLN